MQTLANLKINDENALCIYGASEVFVCNEDFSIVKNGAIAFERGRDEILCVGDFDSLRGIFPRASAYFAPQGILLPALINAHIHFEFGANNGTFAFGDFGLWLDSLMARRSGVLRDIGMITQEGIDEQIKAGVGAVGAISSYGDDMGQLAQSPLRVVYFNEAMGSNPTALDTLYQHFLARLDSSFSLANSRFSPAVALHSPYSLHSIFAKKIIHIAEKQKLPLSAHFLESSQEYEWLKLSSGYFAGFFEKMGIKNAKPFYSAQSFLEMLENLPQSPLLLTHCLQVKDKHLARISQLKASIVTCPRSNRLLANRFLNRANAAHYGINVALGTDGKSSNNNVNLLDEMRAMLYAYPNEEILSLSREIIKSATIRGARALGLNNGSLEVGKSVDFAIFDIARGVEFGADSGLKSNADSSVDSGLDSSVESMDFSVDSKFNSNAESSAKTSVDSRDFSIESSQDSRNFGDLKDSKNARESKDSQNADSKEFQGKKHKKRLNSQSPLQFILQAKSPRVLYVEAKKIIDKNEEK